MKSKTKSVIIGIIVTLLILSMATTVLAVFSGGFKNWDTKTWFGNSESKTETSDPLTPGGVTDENGNQLESGKVYSMPANLVFTSASAASDTASNGVTLSATLTPADATYKDVVWSIAWDNPESAWATGKTVTDYATCTANGLQATVACVQAFGEKINVTVTPKDNYSVSAKCVLDYSKRISNLGFSLKSGSKTINFVDNTIQVSAGSTYAEPISTIDLLSTNTDKYMPEITYDEGTGTISPSLTINYKASLNSTFAYILSPIIGVDLDVNNASQQVDFSNGIIFNNDFAKVVFGGEASISGSKLTDIGRVLAAADREAYKAIYLENPNHEYNPSNNVWRNAYNFLSGGVKRSALQFTITVSDGVGNTCIFTGVAKIGKFLNYKAVNGIALNNSTLVF